MREFGEFAQVGQTMRKAMKILGVLCANREPFEQKAFVFVNMLWVERAHRTTQAQTTGSHTEMETVSEGVDAKAKPSKKALLSQNRGTPTPGSGSPEPLTNSFSLLAFSLSPQESWLLESDFEEKSSPGIGEQMANILSNEGSSTKTNSYLPVSERGI